MNAIETIGRNLRAVAALGLVLAATAPAVGLERRGDEIEGRLMQLESQVQALQAEIQRLRAEAADRRRAEMQHERDEEELERQVVVLTDEIEKRRLGGVWQPPTEGRHGLGPSASKIYDYERAGVSIGGYGEMVYQSFDSERDDGTPAGREDELDFLRSILYFGYKFNDSILFNSEIEFEHASTGKDGEVSVEFAYLDFLHSDLLNVRAGMVLVPVGITNEFHEPTTFLGARRPEVERNVIPTTWRENGVGLFGERGIFSYRAYLTAGLEAADFSASSGIRGGRQSGSESLASDLALSARLDFEPAPGLLVGVSGYLGDAGQGLETPGGEDVDARVEMLDFHLMWEWRALQARALYAQADIDDAAQVNEALGLTGADSIGSELEGWYAEVGYDVLAHTALDQQLIPFLRWSQYDTQVEVPEGWFEDPANDREILTLGLAWYPIPRVVVKLDYQDVDNEAGTGLDQWNVGLGYNF